MSNGIMTLKDFAKRSNAALKEKGIKASVSVKNGKVKLSIKDD